MSQHYSSPEYLQLDRRFLILDIETILDQDLVKKVFKLNENATEEEVFQELYAKYTSGFAPPAFHIPICIALIDVDCDTCKVQNATVLENKDEKILLQKFWKVARQRKGTAIRSTLVTFNGRGFDLPCLFLRSLKHRVPVMPWERNRYSFEFAHDVCDDLSDFGAASRHSLDLIAKLLGFHGKAEVTGAMVQELYKAGELRRIMDYCMQDALNTYQIWLTIRHVRGELSESIYKEACETAAETIERCRINTESSSSEPPSIQE